MKKTLEEQKNRIAQIINEISGASPESIRKYFGADVSSDDKRYRLFDALNVYYDSINDWDKFESELNGMISMVKKNKIFDKDEFEKEDHFGELDEGNAFSGAANKAKEEGKDTFEFDGKTYNVSGTKKEEPKEGATNMAIGFGEKRIK
jgi:hypothetical protein